MREVFIIVDDRTYKSMDSDYCYDTEEKAEEKLEEIRNDIRENSYFHSLADEEELMDRTYVKRLAVR